MVSQQVEGRTQLCCKQACLGKVFRNQHKQLQHGQPSATSQTIKLAHGVEAQSARTCVEAISISNRREERRICVAPTFLLSSDFCRERDLCLREASVRARGTSMARRYVLLATCMCLQEARISARGVPFASAHGLTSCALTATVSFQKVPNVLFADRGDLPQTAAQVQDPQTPTPACATEPLRAHWRAPCHAQPPLSTSGSA